jgi:NADH-quinone oxidoreductase subunit F
MSTNRLNSPAELIAFKDRLEKNRNANKTVVTICAGTGCMACGCDSVVKTFFEERAKDRLENEVEIKATGCHGFCERGPLVVVHPLGVFYQRVKPADAKLIWEQTVKGGHLVNKLLYRDPLSNQTIKHEKDIPFYKKQMRVIFGKNGFMDPTSINDYILLGGYLALSTALTKMTPEQIIGDIKKSGLRGRGGGGFPTGKKWATCRAVKVEPKYVICNADEGDPGAFMDRSLLEGNPHQVIEGMIIGIRCRQPRWLRLCSQRISAGGQEPDDCHQSGPRSWIVGR